MFRGLVLVARHGLGLTAIDGLANAQVIFDRVRLLSLDTTVSDDFGDAAKLTATSVFAGPHHLAALLFRLTDILGDSYLVTTPAPGGANNDTWKNWLQSEAERWPFLWENHKNAIATGFLNQGESLVMTSPTGSGKTTLAALKIAATLACRKTVLYLAPTHALISQVERELNERIAGLGIATSVEDVSLDEIVESLPDLAVVTPERCFALLTFAPELFANVGLLVFDEFHLLGVSRPGRADVPPRVDRRGIDAMLCILTFMTVNSNADYLLLSAMVSNGQEVVDWLQSTINRPVHPFDDKWKPTRQLRCCITYSWTDLADLRRMLGGQPAPQGSRGANTVAAIPYGLFSLTPGWNPAALDKLEIRPFAPGPVPLGTGGQANRRRWLTSNRYGVAATIADQFAQAGLKIIIFCESVPMCVSTARGLNVGRSALEPKHDAALIEKRAAVIRELGSEAAMYDVGAMRAAVHHGELLPDERYLVEATFRNRDSGVNILAATSTLAQGLNLPCDVVILAGTDRIDDTDPDERTRSPLMPHEILNALGRAGRAGYAATGLSVVVPGEPIGCDLARGLFSQNDDLPIIFSDGDQCVPLADPLTTLFDQIEVSGATGEEAEYLLRRLAVSLGTERVGVETFESLTRRSFGFYQRRYANQDVAEAWLAQRKATLTQALAAVVTPPTMPWQEELAAKTGASPGLISTLATAYDQAPLDSGDASDWLIWLLNQLDPAVDDFDAFLRPDTLKRVFGRAYGSQSSEEAMRRVGREGVLTAVVPWFGGQPFIVIESVLSAFIAANEGPVKRPTAPDRKAKRARRFALRLAPDLGFLCGVLTQVARKIAADRAQPVPPMVEFLPQLVRRGYQTPFHYALSRDSPSDLRVMIHAAYESIQSDLERSPMDTWDIVRNKLSAALIHGLFDDLTGDEAAASSNGEKC